MASDPAPTTVGIHPEIARADRLIEQARYRLAAQTLISFLNAHRGHGPALARLGVVANRLGALEQSEHFLRQALMHGVRDFETRKELASVVRQQERPALALTMFTKLAGERTDPQLQAIRASILEKMGHHDEAADLLRKLVQDNADNPAFLSAYGHNLRAAGSVEQAIAAYRQAIDIDDGFGEAWWGLAGIKREVLDRTDILRMQAAIDLAIDVRNIAPLNFALARAHHDLEEYEAAFRYYAEGNRLRAESLQYDPNELTAEIAEIEANVDHGSLSQIDSTSNDQVQPVFVVSLPRSGSTLLEQMLGGHSHIEPIGELPYIPAILRGLMERSTRRGTVTVPEAIGALSNDESASLGREYLRRANLHRKTNRPFFIDKLPHNWSNILFIKRILPNAKFIDIRRPAMDCCFSNFTQSFTSAHASSFTLYDVGRSYRDNIRLMDHFDRIAPGMIMHVDYRRLIAHPSDTLKEALQYLGLCWEDGVLLFHQSDRVVRTLSSEQVRRPLNKDGMEVWKPYSRWLDPLREVLGPGLAL